MEFKYDKLKGRIKEKYMEKDCGIKMKSLRLLSY